MPVVEGRGSAGNAAPEIVTVQGVVGGTAIPVSGSGVSQADDSAFTPDTSSFTPVGGEVDDTATDTVQEGRAGVARITPQRAWHTNLRNNAGTEIGTTSDPVVVGGNVASGSADSGNPVKIGGVARTSFPTAEAAGERVNAMVDVYGRPFVRTATEGLAGNAWTAHHLPAVATQATATKAAAGAGVRNVCTSITVVFAAGTAAPAVQQLSVSLIDGASGGTTYLWRAYISLPATAGAVNGITLQLWRPGSPNTAMTLEWSAAGGANTFQSVSMAGVTVEE